MAVFLCFRGIVTSYHSCASVVPMSLWHIPLQSMLLHTLQTIAVSATITKHIDEDIWELRPGSNRVLYYYCDNDAFVLLHHFRKKTMKTPPREIRRAKPERDDYLARKEADKK